jgi:hypothetical protein
MSLFVIDLIVTVTEGHTCNSESAKMARMLMIVFLIQRRIDAGDVMLMCMLLPRRVDLLPDLSATRAPRPFPTGGTITFKRSRSMTCIHKGLTCQPIRAHMLKVTSACA